MGMGIKKGKAEWLLFVLCGEKKKNLTYLNITVICYLTACFIYYFFKVSPSYVDFAS